MSVSRREFIAAGAAAATTLGMASASRAFAADTKDIRVAQIGFNGQGRGHIRNLGNHIVALCDVDEKVLSAKADELKGKLGRKVDTYTDFRKLLEDKNIDAVSIATPNHTHAMITVAAAQAGKDVYVEKPASHNVWEGRQMIAASRKYDRVIQCGTQSRSSPSLKEAVAFVQSGQLGDIKYALGTCYKARKNIGKSSTPFKFPQWIHGDLWLGPASAEPHYRPVKNEKGDYNPHYDWHWDFNTGNGDMGNQGIHQMDIARWFLGEDSLAPRVMSIGGRLGYEDAGNTPNTQIVYQAYEKAPLIFETRGLPRSKAGQKSWGGSMDRYRGSQIGVIVQCENGYVLVPSYTSATAYDNQGNVVKEWSGGGNHHDNWLMAIASRDRSQLNAEIREGHLSSSLCHTGLISHQVGEKKTAAEIAEAMNMTEAQYQQAVDQLRGVELGVMRELDATDSQGEPLIALSIGDDERPDAQLERTEMRGLLADALGDLPERERQILSLYYEQELTLKEIGEVIGVCESRVSQLRSLAVSRLRVSMREALGQDDGDAAVAAGGKR